MSMQYVYEKAEKEHFLTFTNLAAAATAAASALILTCFYFRRIFLPLLTLPTISHFQSLDRRFWAA